MRSVAISQAGGAEGRRFRFMRRVSQCRGLGGIAGRREERGQVHYRADWLGAGGGTKGDGGDYIGRAIRLIASVPVAAVSLAALLLPRTTKGRALHLLSRAALHDPLALPRRPGRVPARCARRSAARGVGEEGVSSGGKRGA